MKDGLQISAQEEKHTTLSQKLHKQKKNIISGIFFILLAGLTFYAIFHGNDMGAVAAAIRQMQPVYLIGAAALGLFFVSSEGMMIWYLLHILDKNAKFFSCIRYSFVGFFFSGITPSATGGQPMQLYFMSKDKLKISESTVVLMTVAVVYKFVLVVMGLGILLFAHEELAGFLGKYLYLYDLGLSLNVVVVIFLLMVMVCPKVFTGIVFTGERFLVKLHILKHSPGRLEKLTGFVERYHDTVQFFLKNKHRIVAVILFTALQRISVFVLTYVIYCGFQLEGTDALTVILLQASVYIAVDMLPLPGAQGITELMYKSVFSTVFPGTLLTASMCVTRAINFYFLLLVSLGVTVWCYIREKRKRRMQEYKITGFRNLKK